MLDDKSAGILRCVLNSSSYVTIEEVAQKLNISKRTVYYEIKKINGWLVDHNMPPMQHIRSAGLYLEEAAKKIIPKELRHTNPWHYEYSAKERKGWLFIHMLAGKQPVFLQDLMDAIRVSRNTAIQDIKQMKKAAEADFGLKLSFSKQTGYVLQGSELSRRKALNFYMSELVAGRGGEHFIDQLSMVQSSASLFSLKNVAAMQQIIVSCEESLSVQFTDEVLYQFSIQLLLFIRRLALNGRIQMAPAEKSMLRRTREYGAAKTICQQLSDFFAVQIPRDEVDYIAIHVLSAKVNFATECRETEAADWRQLIEQMINEFQKYACVQFRERAGLEKSLLLHIKPAYYRIKYGLHLSNPLLDAIRSKYQDVFLLTQKIMYLLEEQAGKQANPDETAFLAMHFGAWMKREGVEPARRKKALLVCVNGVGTSRILESQLKDLFSTVDIIGIAAKREYTNWADQADFIISTTPLDNSCKPVFIVSPVLSDLEKENLLKKVNSIFHTQRNQPVAISTLLDIIERHANIRNRDKLSQELKEYLYKPTLPIQEDNRPMLHDLITENRIQLAASVLDWQEAIKTAAQPLLTDGCIEQAYITAMIDNINKLGPYVVMGPKVAIPHARPEAGVKKVGMSLLRLEKGVSFSKDTQEEIQIIIILAAIDNETHLKALAQLSNLLMEEDNVQMLCNASSKTAILDLVAKYSI